ncbi:MAG: hypothetical protein ILA06_02180 [Bacteroidaceae bacterium]|nr:hypothetical protein [Bacteroidaceae bacterium]
MNRLKMFFVAAAMLMAGNTMAQKSQTISSVEDTQARVVDPFARAYVKPLTCELEVKTRVAKTYDFTLAEVQAMQGEGGALFDNLRSRAVFKLAEDNNADVIVAATFYIKGNTSEGFHVTVKGFAADFVKWGSATKDDYQWIFQDGTQSTADVQTGAAKAAIKTTTRR